MAVYQPQYIFLAVNDGDTTVRIGAQSGWYTAAFSVATKKLTFILVDIDTFCLNKTKVYNVLQYYSKIQDSAITNSFQFVDTLEITPFATKLHLLRFKKT